MRASDGVILDGFAAGIDPRRLAFDGANIWASNEDHDSVTKLLPTNGTILGTFRVGHSPGPIVFDGTNLWVTNEEDDTVTKLLAADGTILGTFRVGTLPRGITFDGTISGCPIGAAIALELRRQRRG